MGFSLPHLLNLFLKNFLTFFPSLLFLVYVCDAIVREQTLCQHFCGLFSHINDKRFIRSTKDRSNLNICVGHIFVQTDSSNPPVFLSKSSFWSIYIRNIFICVEIFASMTLKIDWYSSDMICVWIKNDHIIDKMLVILRVFSCVRNCLIALNDLMTVNKLDWDVIE